MQLVTGFTAGERALCLSLKQMKLLKYLIFLLVFTAAQAQTTFFKTYGKIPQDYAYSIDKTFDGGYILAGTSNGYGGSNYLYLVRTDGNGDTLWMRGYVTSNTTYGYSVVQCSDSGFALCGNTGFAKVDPNGKMLWNYVHTGTVFYSLRQTADKGFILAGSFGQSGSSNGMDVFLLKTDSNGVKLWSRKFGGPADEFATCVRQTADGNYIVAGSTNSFGAGSWDTYLIRASSSGDTLWTRTCGSTGSDGGILSGRQTIERTVDGGYIIGGYSAGFSTAGSNDAYVIKTDSAGNVSWSRMYGGFGADAINDVKQCSDGGFVFVGNTASSGGGSSDIFLLRTDASGDTLFARCYGGVLNENGYGILETADNGFAICGYTSSFGAGNNDAVLLKVDSLGDAACNQYITGTFISAPATIAAGTATGKIFLTVNVSATTPAAKGGGTVIDACSFIGMEDFTQNDISVYPNPATGAFIVSLAQDGAYRVIVRDVFGKTVYSYQHRSLSRHIGLTLNGLPAGTYLLELSSATGRLFTKLIISR